MAEAVASGHARRTGAPAHPAPPADRADPIVGRRHLGQNLHVGDSTQPLDLTEIEMAEAAQGPDHRREPVRHARELDDDAVAARHRQPRRPSGAASDAGEPVAVGCQAPAPRPRPVDRRVRTGRIQGPTATAASAADHAAGQRDAAPRTPLSAPPPMPRKAQALVRRPPLPTLPNRAFETPWEELAVAYESLPAPTSESRLRWLFRASEVWETGGKDIARAFDALARAFSHGAARARQGMREVRARLHRIAPGAQGVGPARRPLRGAWRSKPRPRSRRRTC